MAKTQRSILFVASQSSLAQAAATAFLTSCQRLGLEWPARTSEFTGSLAPSVLEGVSVVVAVDLPDFELSEGNIRFERLVLSSDLEQAVQGLLARLLGGSETSAISRPPPPPPPPKKLHTVKLSRETAGRKGKGVTVISELPLNDEELKELATHLKNKCGTGGTAKDGRIEIQGDHRDKLCVELEKLGYKVKRAGG